MPITGQCQGCGRKFQAPDNLAGKRVKCPKCSAMIEVGHGTSHQAGKQPDAVETTVPKPPKQPRPDKPEWSLQTPDGEEQGPMAKSELDDLVAKGEVNCFCYVRREGWDDWKPAEAVYPEFAIGGLGASSDDDAAAGLETSPLDLPDLNALDTSVEPGPRLRPCADCGKKISRRATQCPHCGCPVTAPSGSEPSAEGEDRARRRWVPWVVGSLVALLVIAVTAGGVTLWLFSRVKSEVAQVIAAPLPEPPEAPGGFDTPEEFDQYLQETAAAMAKHVDEQFAATHLATSTVDAAEELAALYQSLAEPMPFRSQREDPELKAPTPIKPYESQYDALFEECLSHLRDNIPFDTATEAKVAEIAKAWADEKLAPVEETMKEVLKTGFGP